MKKIIALSLLYLFMNSCLIDRFESRDIKITNKLGYDIYCFNSMNDSLTEYLQYLKSENMEVLYRIPNDSSNIVYNVPRSWDSYIKNSDSGKMRLFFVADDTVAKYGWRRTFENNIYSRRLLIDLNDLNALQWQIIVK